MKITLKRFQGSWKMKNDNFDFMGHEYTIKYASCRAMKPYTMYIDFMGHESSKKSVPWIELHPEI